MPATYSRQSRSAPLIIGVLLAALLVAGCGKKADAPAAGAASGPPPAEVGVVTVATRDVGLITELPGRLEASRVAQVRARAAGILQKRLFREGSDVRAGQALFKIDSAPYQAALQSGHFGAALGTEGQSEIPRDGRARGIAQAPLPQEQHGPPLDLGQFGQMANRGAAALNDLFGHGWHHFVRISLPARVIRSV